MYTQEFTKSSINSGESHNCIQTVWNTKDSRSVLYWWRENFLWFNGDWGL